MNWLSKSSSNKFPFESCIVNEKMMNKAYEIIEN